jgi:Transposase DDE domain
LIEKDHHYLICFEEQHDMSQLISSNKRAQRVDSIKVFDFVNSIFGETMHLKRVGSIADAAIGLLYAEELILHKIGAGLATAMGLDKKHTTKQIDRLLSNKKFDIWQESGIWASHIIGNRKEIMVSMDWTDFDADSQSTIAINLLTEHGRATPLLWKTVNKSTLKNNRARYEDHILSKLKEIVPSDVKVTILADRGFADQLFFKFIAEQLGFFYIIRTRSNINISNQKGIMKLAKDWLNSDGRIKTLSKSSVTEARYPVEKFVCTKQKGMKDAWFLVSNRKELSGSQIVKFYGKRWTIEPYFRDIKNQRFGMGLSETHIRTPERRDRLFFISAIVIALLTIFGAAGESIGFDRKLKVNTVKTRTHSLLNQGIFYYKCFNNFKTHEQDALLTVFNELLVMQPYWPELLLSI